jgi:hypothetical protein
MLVKVMTVLKWLSPLLLVPFFILVTPTLTYHPNDDPTNTVFNDDSANDTQLLILRIWLIVIATSPMILGPQAQYYSRQLTAIIEKGLDTLPEAARIQRQQSAKNIRAVLLPATIGPILFFIALVITTVVPQLLVRHTYMMSIYTFLNHIGTGGIVKQLNPNINLTIAGAPNRIQVGGSTNLPPVNPMLRSYTSRNLFAQQHLFAPAASAANGHGPGPLGLGLPKDSSSNGGGNFNGGLGSFRRSHSAMYITQSSPRTHGNGNGNAAVAPVATGAAASGSGSLSAAPPPPQPLGHMRYPSDGLGSIRNHSQRYLITSVATSPVPVAAASSIGSSPSIIIH